MAVPLHGGDISRRIDERRRRPFCTFCRAEQLLKFEQVPGIRALWPAAAARRHLQKARVGADERQLAIGRRHPARHDARLAGRPWHRRRGEADDKHARPALPN